MQAFLDFIPVCYAAWAVLCPRPRAWHDRISGGEVILFVKSLYFHANEILYILEEQSGLIENATAVVFLSELV